MKIITKKRTELSKSEKEFMNKARMKEWGTKEKKDYDAFFEPNTIFFFVKEGNKVVSMGGLRPITITYHGKKYNIKGICGIVAIEKKKGYGKAVIQAMIKYFKKTGKTGLGFCGKQNTIFYQKAGLKTEPDFIKRFIYRDPKSGKEVIDNDGDGLYYEGKDKFVSKVLGSKNKDIVYINVLHW